MKVTAIIAEYNPLHNGHAAHIETARRETGADFIIAVMSGNYVQRGAPAMILKYERARYALLAGCDLILELPHYYSTGSLDYFAKGAVSLLAKTGITDCISFGSECGDIRLLKEASDVITSNNASFDPAILKRLSQGLNYSNALNSSPKIPEHIQAVLKTPNNLLAASYISAARKMQFECCFHTMKRAGAAYHDSSKGALSSTSVRKEILTALCHYEDQDMDVHSCTYKNNRDLSLHNILHGRVPDDSMALLLKYLNEYPPMSEDSFSLLLFAKIQEIIKNALCEGDDPALLLSSYLDVSDSLAHKIMSSYAHASSYTALCQKLKSKDINHARISRALIHILLDLKKSRMDEYVSSGYNHYVRILGFKHSASELMHTLKKHCSVPLISKNADAALTLDPIALRMFNEGILADELYYKTACTMYRRPFVSEYERSPVNF